MQYRVISGVMALTMATMALGAEGRIYQEDNVGISGADPVVYFELAEARQGEAEHSYQWRGAEWRVVNAGNRDLALLPSN